MILIIKYAFESIHLPIEEIGKDVYQKIVETTFLRNFKLLICFCQNKIVYYGYDCKKRLTILNQLTEIEHDLKFEIETSYDEVRSDKLSKHHDNIKSLIKDLVDGL